MRTAELIRATLGLDIARSADPMTRASFGSAADLFTSSKTRAGLSITERNSLQISTVWTCVRIVSNMVSTLPIDSHIRRDGVRTPWRPRPAWIDDPGRISRIDFITMVMVSLMLWGNAYVVTLRRGGLIIGLDVLSPMVVTPHQGGTFTVHMNDGTVQTAGPSEIVHLRGAVVAPGEIKGLSPIMESKETFGLARASIEFGSSFFGKGALPGGLIEDPGKMSEIGAKIMRDTWAELHAGVDNAHRVAVLTEGAKFSKVTINPDDAQFLQTRQLSAAEISAMFGVPLFLVNMEGPQFGDTTSEQGVALVQHTARPWVERIEWLYTRLLTSDGAPPSAFVKLNVSGLMRGDFTQRYQTYNSAVTQGILTINEVRALEDLPPVPWGDEPISVQVQEGANQDEQPSGDQPIG